MIDRRRGDSGERLIHAAERLIEPVEQLLLETRGEGRTRRVDERTDAFETEPTQGRAGLRRKTQCFDRQRGKSCGFLSRTQDHGQVGVATRQRPGHPWCIGDGKPCRQAETVKPMKKIGK